MNGTYRLERSEEELRRFTVRSEKGVVYVYRRFEDRWDITKLTSLEIIEAAANGISGSVLLEERPVTYRISGGSCSCPGFNYHRGMCKHMDEVKARVGS